MATPTMTLQLDPATCTSASAELVLFASTTGQAVGFATASGMAIAGVRTDKARPLRTVTDGVLNTTTTVTSATAAFTHLDVGRGISGTGIPAGAYVASVTDATTVDLSAAATATATGVTLTLGTLGLLVFRDLNPNQAEEGEFASDDVIDDPSGTAWRLVVKPNSSSGAQAPLYFNAPDLSGFHDVAANLSTEPGAIPTSGTVTILEGLVDDAVGDLTDVNDLPEALRNIAAGDDMLVIQDEGLVRADASDVLDRANHTGTQLASTISNFDTQVRTSRIDQMAAPTSALTWSASLTIGNGTALHGSVGVGATAFGPLITLLGNTADTQPRAVYSGTQIAYGPGGSTATDTTIVRSGVAALTVTGSITTSAGITATTGGVTATAGGLTATAGGLTVTAGSVSLPAGSIANAALTQALSTSQYTAATGTAADGSVTVGASSIFGGGILLLKGDTTDAQAKASYTSSGINFGPGGASAPTEVTFARTGTNAAAITVTTLTIAGNVTLSGRNIITDTTTGLKIGTATSQKLGFFNATPVVRRTLAATATDAATTQTLANSLRTALVDLGFGA